MKKCFKILGITLGVLLATVILVASILVWVVFTPEKLTPIARQVSDKFISCEHEIGEVDLTFFSTFPEFGLRADGLLLLNPMDGAQSDTLLSVPKVVATIDVVAFLRDSKLVLREVSLEDAIANLYINANGVSNTDVFLLASDTASNDTSAFSLPFDEIEVGGLSLVARQLTFCDNKDSIAAALQNACVAAKIDSWDDVVLDVKSESVSACLKGVQYAENLNVQIHLPAAVDLNTMHFALRDAEVRVNEFAATLDGQVTIADTIDVDARLVANKWQIRPLLALVPESYRAMLSDLDVDGRVSLDATARGQYSETQMPIVDAHLELEDGEGAYKPLPYTLRDLTLKADAHLNLKDSTDCRVTISSLSGKTKNTTLSATGVVSELLADMLIDLRANVDANIPDFAYFMPDGMQVDGRAKGTAAARLRLSDLTDMKLGKGLITGDLKLSGIKYQQDSMSAQLPNTHITLRIPNNAPSHKKTNWLAVTAELEGLDFCMGEGMKAQLGQSTLKVEACDVLSKDPVLYAAVDLASAKPLTAVMDSMGGTIVAPRLKAYAEYNTKDTTIMPTLKADLAFDDLKANYSDIDAHLAKSTIQASISGGHKDKSYPRLNATITTDALQAKMGTDMSAKTDALHLEASARYNSRGKNLLLKWNPRFVVKLKGGEAHTAMVPVPVYIPSIDFAYSNKTCEIKDSHILMGKSDFSLTGRVDSIGTWMRRQSNLVGELTFASDYTDINELMAFFSAESGSEEAADGSSLYSPAPLSPEGKEGVGKAKDTTAKPFMVPARVDLTLNTNIKNAVIWDENISAMGGRVYVKNGVVVLEQVGFICKAAKLQLTAMYRTPRRNDIYVGFDYHMLDVDIKELVHMIPQLDTLLPMLRSFAGKAEFHLAAETYTNARYEPKYSTLRGAASIFGKDLTVLDNETFSTISKLLTFKKRTENKIDSVSAELTVYKKEIDVYPFCVNWDKYMVALGGRHNLDMTFNYDVNVLSPIYLGVNVSGNMDDLKIKLAKCKFAQDFRPIFHRKVDTQSAELRNMIRESMRKNVKIQ